MNNREALRQEIEDARFRLDDALERANSIEECYELSLRLDKLIENYIELCEQRELVSTE